MDLVSVIIILVGLFVSILLAEASVVDSCVAVYDIWLISYSINIIALEVLQSIHHPFSLWFLSIPYGRMSIFETIYSFFITAFILFILALIDTAAAVMYIIIRAEFFPPKPDIITETSP